MPQTLAGKNAKDIGALFRIGAIIGGSLTFNATTTTDTLAHGLGVAPDFVLLTFSGETSGDTYTWTTDTTTLTVTRETTVGAETWSYLIGVLT